MFIQIIQGKCSRQQELHEHLDTWRNELGSGAPGWLGGTYGFTDDDMFMGVVRFDSRDSAMANSGRPEQDAWAARMMELFDGPVEFHDCDDVTLMMDGGSDDAGFVQVMKSSGVDRDKVHEMDRQFEEVAAQWRPDLIGSTRVWTGPDRCIEVAYFISEAAAREGERKAPPPEVRSDLEYAMADAQFYDLHRPWFASR